MARVPTKVQDLLNLCGTLGPVWSAAPASLGITPLQASGFVDATAQAVEAVAEQAAAKKAAESATSTARSKVSDLRSNIASVIRSIDTFALASSDPAAVWAAAQIPAPQPRTPSEPPGQAFQVTATLDDEGNITLKWKCQNPPGGNVVYSVTRRQGTSGAFVQVGISGKRSFTDQTIPAGSPVVQYVIRGYRGQTVGPASAIFTLQFGQGGGGLVITSASTEGEAKAGEVKAAA